MDCWFFGMYVFLSFFKIGDLIEVSLVISYGQSLIVLCILIVFVPGRK